MTIQSLKDRAGEGNRVRLDQTKSVFGWDIHAWFNFVACFISRDRGKKERESKRKRERERESERAREREREKERERKRERDKEIER